MEVPMSSSTQSKRGQAAATTERAVDTVTAELDAARVARESATGTIKGNLTRQIKALQAELAALTPATEPVLLADLEADLIAQIKAGTLPRERADVAAAGDRVLTTSGIRFYRAARWD